MRASFLCLDGNLANNIFQLYLTLYILDFFHFYFLTEKKAYVHGFALAVSRIKVAEEKWWKNLYSSTNSCPCMNRRYLTFCQRYSERDKIYQHRAIPPVGSQPDLTTFAKLTFSSVDLNQHKTANR
jgi:hypothetical protein